MEFSHVYLLIKERCFLCQNSLPISLQILKWKKSYSSFFFSDFFLCGGEKHIKVVFFLINDRNRRSHVVLASSCTVYAKGFSRTPAFSLDFVDSVSVGPYFICFLYYFIQCSLSTLADYIQAIDTASPKSSFRLTLFLP